TRKRTMSPFLTLTWSRPSGLPTAALPDALPWDSQRWPPGPPLLQMTSIASLSAATATPSIRQSRVMRLRKHRCIGHLPSGWPLLLVILVQGSQERGDLGHVVRGQIDWVPSPHSGETREKAGDESGLVGLG